MPKIIFTDTFNYRPTQEWHVTMVYRPSDKPQQVNLECAEQAVELGVGHYANPEDAKERERRAEKKSKIQRNASSGGEADNEGDAEGSQEGEPNSS